MHRPIAALAFATLVACSTTRAPVRATPTEAKPPPSGSTATGTTFLTPAELGALAGAYGQLGGAFGQQKWDAVLQAAQAALEVNPGDEGMIYTAAYAHAQAGRPDDAFVWLEKLVPLKSSLVPDPNDFTKLAGDRLDRISAELRKNVPPHAPVAFTLDQRDLIAEGIAHDPKTGTFFVSSIYHRKVVAVDREGNVRDFVTTEEAPLMSTLGLRVDPERRVLWVASAYTPSMKNAAPEEDGRAALHKFELETGRELARYPRGSADRKSLLNDVAMAKDGTVYVTDSEAGEVLRLAPEAPSGAGFEVLVPTGTHFYTNGIALADDQRTLFFADWVNGVTALDLDTRKRTVLTHPRGRSTHGFDGLYFHEGALVAVDNGTGPGRVVKLTLAPSYDRVTEVKVLESAHPLSQIPTTGVIANGALHLIVNSQLRAFENGKILPWERLQPVHVVKVPLGSR